MEIIPDELRGRLGMINKKLSVIAALLFGFSGSANAILFNGHDYIAIDAEGISWDDAKAAALPGYHLATISSVAENDFIRDLINLLNGEEYWLGGSQPAGSATGDDWSWENGEGLFWDLNAAVVGAYENWNPFPEPSGDGNHLAMWADDNRFGFTAGTWNDEGAVSVDGYLDGYVLESVPEPGTIALFGLGLAGLGFARRKKA